MARSLAHALAAALIDGPWHADAMHARLRAVVGADRAWMRSLVRAALHAYAEAPVGRFDALVDWLESRRMFAAAARDRPTIRHWPTPPHEMADSPWPVPALATTRELAMWLGIPGDALRVLGD